MHLLANVGSIFFFLGFVHLDSIIIPTSNNSNILHDLNIVNLINIILIAFIEKVFILIYLIMKKLLGKKRKMGFN